MAWPYDVDNFHSVWQQPSPQLEALKKRDDELLRRVENLEATPSRIVELERVVERLTLFNVLYQFYFEEVFTKDEVKRLVTMLNSPDEQDKSLARDMILQKIK